MIKRPCFALALGAMLGLATLPGCSTWDSLSGREKATVGGAAAGGAVGAAVGGGTLGTVGGAAAGGLIGNQLGKERDKR